VVELSSLRYGSAWNGGGGVLLVGLRKRACLREHPDLQVREIGGTRLSGEDGDRGHPPVKVNISLREKLSDSRLQNKVHLHDILALQLCSVISSSEITCP